MAQARKFDTSKTIKQIDAKGFEKVGQSYEGTFVGTKQATINEAAGVRESTLIMLQPDEGDKFAVWANAILEEMISQVQIGTYIKITHTGVGKAKGKKQGAKMFEIVPAV